MVPENDLKPHMTRRLAAFLALLPIVSSAGRAQGPSEPGPPDATWARLHGRVVDSSGRPAADIPVQLQCNWLDGQWGRLEGTTDANGQFAIGTPPGQCRLALNVRGIANDGPAVRLFEFAPGETVETVRTLDRSLTPQPLEGRLLDDRGEPIGGVRVILRSSIVLAGTRQWRARPPVQADATGAFRFPAVWAGTWEVVVPALGLSRLVEIPRDAPAPGSPAPLVIRGARVPAFRVSGRVETPPGTARRYASVYLDRDDTPSANPLTIAETAADDTGAFAFPAVPAGSYRIRVDTSATAPPGPGRGPFEIIFGITRVVVTGDVSGVVVMARPGPELRAEVRLDDQPLAPGQRVLLDVDAAGGRFVPLIYAEDGYLITHGLVPERYRIRFTGVPTGYRIKSVTVGGRDVTEEGFDLADGPIDDMIITLTRRLTEVKGVVRDAQDRPDGEAAVLAFPTDRRLWTETGQAPAFIGNAHVSQKGNYSVKGLPAGEYFVVATLSDSLLTTDAETLARLVPQATRVRLADAEAVTLNLRTAH